MMNEPQYLGRSLARFMAVQALYAMDVGQLSFSTIKEMLAFGHFGDGEDVNNLVDEDQGYFEKLVSGVAQEQKKIDAALKVMLPKDWPLNRIDATLRALLRVATFELLLVSDVPVKVVLDEYIEIAKDFFDGEEQPKFVNGVLDGLVRHHGLGA